jgi:hypothetical protein
MPYPLHYLMLRLINLCIDTKIFGTIGDVSWQPHTWSSYLRSEQAKYLNVCLYMASLWSWSCYDRTKELNYTVGRRFYIWFSLNSSSLYSIFGVSVRGLEIFTKGSPALHLCLSFERNCMKNGHFKTEERIAARGSLWQLVKCHSHINCFPVMSPTDSQ